jgi:uncharacterized repeat protein (TIGR01451 family)
MRCETRGRGAWRIPRSLAALALVAAAGLVLDGCDQDDNDWNSVPPGDYPDLALTMSVDLNGSPAPHELLILHYVVTTANRGALDATAVVVADTLPAAVAFQDAAASQGAYDPATGYWTVGTLAPDSSATLTLTVELGSGTRGQTVANEARVYAVEPADLLPGNDRAAASFTVIHTAPSATPDGYVVSEGGTLSVPAPGLLANDGDADGESFEVSVVPAATPQHGSLTLYANGSFDYVHSGSEDLTDSFRYVVVDASAEADTGLVTIAINPVNDRPLLQPIPPQTIGEGQAFPGLTLDDYVDDPDDPDADLVWEALGATALVVTISPARVATVTVPSGDWNGQEIVTFRVTDPWGLQVQRAVTFSVTPVDDAPVVSDIPDQVTTAGGSFLPIPLDDVVSDIDNTDAQIFWTYSGNGALLVSISANRVATITPPSPGWTGQATITFRATDPGGLWDEDSARFTVSAGR